MSVTPFSWNVVVIGAWNLAILTPDGVRRRLLELPDNTPLEIEIPIDAPGAPRIGHEGILVIPAGGRLEVATRTADQASLVRTRQVCVRALESLPETPVTAVGINIRYRFPELPDKMYDLIRTPLDEVLSDAGHQIGTTSTARGLLYPPGVVNLRITPDQEGGTVEFNFHRDSRSPKELADWLGNAEEFVSFSEQLSEILGVTDVRGTIHA